MMATLDDALVQTYQDFNVPVDRFLGDERLIESFIAALAKRAQTVSLDSQAIMHRLVNLRKRGLLPRLRRNYYGRSASDN